MFRQVIKASRLTPGLRGLTTKTTITDHTTGRIITLTDPAHPEMGDYPNPAPVLAQNKDPYAKYDDQQHRRNFNDPVNFDDDLYDMWSPDYFQTVSDATALKHNGIFFGSIFGIAGLIYYFEWNQEKPAMPRSYPYNGLAKSLGSDSEEHDEFYNVKADIEADSLSILPADATVTATIEAYKAAHAEFIEQ